MNGPCRIWRRKCHNQCLRIVHTHVIGNSGTPLCECYKQSVHNAHTDLYRLYRPRFYKYDTPSTLNHRQANARSLPASRCDPDSNDYKMCLDISCKTADAGRRNMLRIWSKAFCVGHKSSMNNRCGCTLCCTYYISCQSINNIHAYRICMCGANIPVWLRHSDHIANAYKGHRQLPISRLSTHKSDTQAVSSFRRSGRRRPSRCRLPWSGPGNRPHT